LKDKTVLKLAEKNGMDAGQILQSWAVGRGTVPLGKGQTECKFCLSIQVRQAMTEWIAQIKSNLAVRKFSPEDMKALDDIAIANEEGRTINPSKE